MTSVHQRYDGRILKKECVSLARNGYDVTLIVADNKDDEIYNGVKITSIKFIPRNRFDRILHAKKKIFAKALSLDAHIYHFHDPELIPVGLALLKKGKKVIYDSHEDYPKDIRYKKAWLPLIGRWLISHTFALYEKYASECFSAIISVTPQIVDRFLKFNQNTFLITNYPLFVPEEDLNVTSKKQSEKILACFAGIVDFPWVQDNFILAIQNTDIEYLIAGSLGKASSLERLESLDTNNQIKYVGVIPQEKVWNIYKKASIGVAIAGYDPTEFNKEGSIGVNKLFEYMMFGLPVICTDFTLWKAVIDKWKCGFAINPNNIESLHNLAEYICKNPNILIEMGKRARQAAIAEYNWPTQESVLLSVYRNILKD